MAPSDSSPLPAAASPSGGPQATNARASQLQALYGQLTARVTAVEKDVGWALSEHERQIHRERLAELRADRAPAWRPLVAAWQGLPPAAARSVWRDALPALATRSRADLYLDLALIAPVLPALAGQGAAAEIARAILDVSAWWP